MRNFSLELTLDIEIDKTGRGANFVINMKSTTRQDSTYRTTFNTNEEMTYGDEVEEG